MFFRKDESGDKAMMSHMMPFGSSTTRRTSASTRLASGLPADAGAISDSDVSSRAGSGSCLLRPVAEMGDDPDRSMAAIDILGEACALPTSGQFPAESLQSSPADSSSPASSDGGTWRKSSTNTKGNWTRQNRVVYVLLMLAMVAALCFLAVYISWTLLSAGHQSCGTTEWSPSVTIGSTQQNLKDTTTYASPATKAADDMGYLQSASAHDCITSVHAVPGQKSNSVMMVTAIPPVPCPGMKGDFRNLQSILNKVDYTRLHSYDLYVGAKLEHSLFGGPWNKIVLLQRLMRDTKYEWLMWMDMDTVIEDMAFRVLLASYTNKSLVIWGNETELFDNNNSRTGINTGIFLLRNNQWSRDFLARVMLFGEKYYNKNEGTEMDKRMALHKDFPGYDFALFDQNGFAHELQSDRGLMSEVVFENSYILNGYWNDTKSYSQSTFINHFSGCQFCSGIQNGAGKQCHQAYSQSFHSARARAESLLRPAGSPSQGQDSPTKATEPGMGLP